MSQNIFVNINQVKTHYTKPNSMITILSDQILDCLIKNLKLCRVAVF